MNEVVDEILKIRNSDINVLITGESGTGKELIARAVHYVSARKDKVFVPFNCTAVPKELTEGHLFGYKKGAFTGATTDSDGMIRSADGGTLFLDEIGDLPLDVQPKILRFLQEGEVQPLGEKAPKKVDVRIVTATNMNLEEMVMQGLFREDLYFRLNVIRLRIPPLRDRRSEIPQLVNHFLSVYSAKFGRKNLTMSSEALDLLIAFNWKGNVRQLCNEVQRIVARSDDGDKITPRHLSEDIKTTEAAASENNSNTVKTIGLTSGAINIQTQGVTLEEAVSALEIQMITESLNRHEHNISRVAKELNLTRRGLYLKLDRYKMR
jgi:Nif-specific regulatory protein